MSESRRPPRRGRGRRPSTKAGADTTDNPYREDGGSGAERPEGGGEREPGEERSEVATAREAPVERPVERPADRSPERAVESPPAERPTEPISARPVEAPEIPAEGTTDRSNNNGAARYDQAAYPTRDRLDRADRGDRGDRGDRAERGERPDGGGGAGGSFHDRRNGRRHRRGRGRGPRREHQPQQPPQPIQVAATGETRGWFDPARDAGFIRRSTSSYLAEPGDAYVPPHIVRQFQIRKADLIDAAIGYDQRGRSTVVEVRTINDMDPTVAMRRPEFNSLTASYPERKLFMETGRPAKGGSELIRRAIDLIAPIGYGQRALIVAPARAGKTTLLHAITEGVAINHPNAVLLILLVDERPEEVSEAISWGVGEVISSSFDQPAQRHVEVTEMVLNRAHRLVEGGKDVVIVLDSLTRMARAHNTAERGTGRTLSGGLDATAMAKPKAFFGSARAIPQSSGGGSLTIIATALVETGSRMDDVIFEEFKGTGNCEIKLDRGLAEKRIYPAIDIGTSGTRREEKLFRPDQIDSVYTLRRGLSQMPPQSAMEWLIKRIAATPSNDALLAGL
jgi:transcription termination factor Rho